MKKNIGFPFLMGLAAAALFGAATPSSKVLLVSLSAFQLAGLLYLGGAAGVIPLLLRKKDLAAPWHFTKNTRVRLLGAVFFGGCLGPVFLLLGLRQVRVLHVAVAADVVGDRGELDRERVVLGG